METKKTIKLTLEIDLDISGKVTECDVIEAAVCHELNENMPSLILDSDELDCQIFTDTWRYEVVKGFSMHNELVDQLKKATDALAGGLWDYGPGQDEQHDKCDEIISECRALIAKVEAESE